MAHELTWTADADPLRRRLDSLEQLTACYQKALGHELPNQLVAVQGMARLLEGELRDRLDPETAKYLDRLAHLVQRADSLVRALAEIGRMCRDPGTIVTVALREAVAEAATEVKLLFSRRIIDYDLQDMMPVVNVPRRPLQLALLHLLRNAVEATPEDQPAQIRVTTDSTADGIALHVADRGRGLTETQRTTLFLPFAGDTATGQGLGLFLVRQAAALWEGGVRVRSEPGNGTTFTLLFPGRTSGPMPLTPP